ncbi:MAG: hypothetical protein II236_00265 [Alistipes sp.]|nr:hypothetical protein [Alistipes sp.]
MYRSINIAVDCANDEEQKTVQAIAKDASETMKLKASDVIRFYPLYRKNSGLIISAIRAISQEGMKGVMRVVPNLIKNFKK